MNPPGAAPSANPPLAATAPLPVQPPASHVPAATAPLPQQPAGRPGRRRGSGRGAKGSAFRETLWFKKGDVEHMIAEARAKMAAQGAKPVEGELPLEEAKPIEDRYKDDGTVTSEDRKKFSLRTGGIATGSSLPAVKAQVPGEAMTEKDVIAEVSGSRRTTVLAVAAIVVLAVVAAVVMMMRGRPQAPPPASAPAASVIPAPPVPAAAAKPPEPPIRTAKGDNKIVAAPPNKRSDGSDKRASRRKATGSRKRTR